MTLYVVTKGPRGVGAAADWTGVVADNPADARSVGDDGSATYALGTPMLPATPGAYKLCWSWRPGSAADYFVTVDSAAQLRGPTNLPTHRQHRSNPPTMFC